jgi:diguanylate cyclase (GGDEF)-like protein
MPTKISMADESSAERLGQRRLPLQKKPWQPVSLSWMLTVPFILQVVTVVGLVGYLSHRNGQRSVENLTNQLMNAVGQRVEQKLTSYLDAPQLASKMVRDATLRGDLSLDLSSASSQRDRYLWQQIQLFENLAWISLGSEQGDSLGITRPEGKTGLQISSSNRTTKYFGNYYELNSKGERSKLLKIERPVFDPRTRPWYKAAIAAQRPVWTKIYPGFSPGTIFIAASEPLYDPTGKLVGVSGIDVSLLALQKFLAATPVSANSQVFLMEKSGMLVASSSQERPFITNGSAQPQRLAALHSKTPLISSTTNFLQKQFGDLYNIRQRQEFSFEVNGQQQFVQVLPFSQGQGLDWVIAIVVPESDVMAQIRAGTFTTIALCLTALMAVIVLNYTISRWLARPILSMNQASQRIRRGDFSQETVPRGVRELAALADSFGLMSQELQQSRQELEEYSRSLEQKVSDRTQELQAEVQKRAAAEESLRKVNWELSNLAYMDALTQIANRRQFDDRLQQEWYRLKREQKPLSIILCDVDYFKQYNDTYGHQVGDQCLRLLAGAIAAAARRAADLPARYGGEEFVVILPNTPLVGAIQVAKMIQERVANLILSHKSSLVSRQVTMSLGVTTLVPTDLNSMEMLLTEADRLLYQAKSEGRNRIVSSG